MKTHTEYDVVIVGAGLVGSSLALSLKNTDLKVLCLDRKPLILANDHLQDERPISLSYSSVVILKKWGVWQELEQFSTPIQSVHVSNQGGFGRLEFQAADYQLPALGYVVPYVHLERFLLQHAFENTHLAYREIKEVDQLRVEEEKIQLKLSGIESKETIMTQLVAAADGTYSRIRQLAEIEPEMGNDSDVAVTARLYLQKAHHNKAYERFTPDGTFALLPHWNPKSVNLVWSQSAKQWEEWKQQETEVLLRKIQQVFGYRLGKILGFELMNYYPLKTAKVTKLYKKGVVLLGNAAHSFYPLAAQGFNLALRDSLVLSEILQEAHLHGKSLAEDQLLESYQSLRSADQYSVAKLTNTLHRGFGLKIPTISAFRSLALLAIDLTAPLKKHFTKRCLGLVGRVPALIRDLL